MLLLLLLLDYLQQMTSGLQGDPIKSGYLTVGLQRLSVLTRTE